MPVMSKYQNTALHFILLIPTDHIFCVRQILRKKIAYIQAVHYMIIELKYAYNSIGREVLYNIV